MEYLGNLGDRRREHPVRVVPRQANGNRGRAVGGRMARKPKFDRSDSQRART